MLPLIADCTMLDGARMSNPEEFLPADAMFVLEYAYEGKPLDLKKVNKGGKTVKF
jgi:hypothetical protein